MIRPTNPTRAIQPKAKKILNEFFYELTKNKTGMFLSYDAFMSVIEISAHKLYQI